VYRILELFIPGRRASVFWNKERRTHSLLKPTSLLIEGKNQKGIGGAAVRETTIYALIIL